MRGSVPRARVTGCDLLSVASFPGPLAFSSSIRFFFAYSINSSALCTYLLSRARESIVSEVLSFSRMSALLRALRGRLPPTHFLSAMQAASLSQPGLWSSASPSCGTAFTQPSTRGLAVSVSPPVRAMDDITAEPTLQRYLKLAHRWVRPRHL